MSYYKNNTIALEYKDIKIRWIFQFEHDYQLASDHTLSWVMRDRNCRLIDPDLATFNIGIYPGDGEFVKYMESLPGQSFLLNGESWQQGTPPWSHSKLGTFGTKVDAVGPNWLSPTLIFWSPSHSVKKTQKCSVVESGMYQWRNEFVGALMDQVQEVVGFGNYFNNSIPSAHGKNNQKFTAIKDYAFSIAVENKIMPDYMTEKFNDIILNEAVPIYHGATNLSDYCLPDAVILPDKVGLVDWEHWEEEYARRRPAILRQKEILRTRFNIFSYFIAIAANQELLKNKRPITLDTDLD